MQPQLHFEVSNQIIKRVDDFVVVAGSKNYLKAKFDFKTEEWVGEKVAVFYNETANKKVKLEEDVCYVPWEVIKSRGTVCVSVSCGDFIPSNIATVYVLESGNFNADEPLPPSPNLYEQLLAKIKEAELRTEAAANKAEEISNKIEDVAEDVAKVESLVWQAEMAAEKAENVSLNPPKIVEGNWYVCEDGIYKDTGIVAEGRQGPQGIQGKAGEPFAIKKIYKSVEEMNAGLVTDEVKEGQFVVIDTGNVEDEDNAKLFVKGAEKYMYLTDMSGAQGLQGPQGLQGIQGLPGQEGAAGLPGKTPEKGVDYYTEQDKKELLAQAYDSIYPVNCIMPFYDNEDHSGFCGLVWERCLQGRSPIGIDESLELINTVGAQAGSFTHNINSAEAPELNMAGGLITPGNTQYCKYGYKGGDAPQPIPLLHPVEVISYWKRIK